jgi:hypothetical protein
MPVFSSTSRRLKRRSSLFLRSTSPRDSIGPVQEFGYLLFAKSVKHFLDTLSGVRHPSTLPGTADDLPVPKEPSATPLPESKVFRAAGEERYWGQGRLLASGAKEHQSEAQSKSPKDHFIARAS